MAQGPTCDEMREIYEVLAELPGVGAATWRVVWVLAMSLDNSYIITGEGLQRLARLPDRGAVHRALKPLRAAGLVEATRWGRQMRYELCCYTDQQDAGDRDCEHTAQQNGEPVGAHDNGLPDNGEVSAPAGPLIVYKSLKALIEDDMYVCFGQYLTTDLLDETILQRKARLDRWQGVLTTMTESEWRDVLEAERRIQQDRHTARSRQTARGGDGEVINGS